MTRPLEIGIVGAGLAGLRCADVLLRHGCKVTIFEARNRLGGRVAQSKHLGHLVDLGPNWIHGAKGNAISALARTTATTVCPWEEDEAVFHSDGQYMDGDEAAEYQRLLWEDGLIAAATRYSKQCHDSIDPHRSLHDFFKEKAESLFTDEVPKEAKRKRRTLLLVASSWGAWVGSPIQRQSLRDFWLEEWIDGENVFVAETYSKILEEVAKFARSRAEIRLSSEVTGIRSQGDEGSAETSTVSIQTLNDESHFDEVVVTTPLGWLKRNQNAFHPPLPIRLSQAIGNIGYGTLDKVYITFHSPFWDPPSSKKHGAANRRSETPSHPPKKLSAPHHSPGFTHWLSPTYAGESNPQHWDQVAMNLAALPADCAHSTLLFYIYGPCSVHIAQMVADAENEAQRDAEVLNFFKPYYSLLPNFDDKDPACHPKAVLATAWANDAFAGYGSYSNFQVGLENGKEDIEVMRYGLPERNIWLAGEHTAPIDFLATTTGAYLSGEAVGMRIAEKHELVEGEM